MLRVYSDAAPFDDDPVFKSVGKIFRLSGLKLSIDWWRAIGRVNQAYERPLSQNGLHNTVIGLSIPKLSSH